MRFCSIPAPRVGIVLLAVSATLLAGCSFLLGARNDPVRLYVLNPEPPASAPAAVPASLSLGFGPVSLPGYLDRQGIVTRVETNRLEAARNDLWAEPLGASFRDVLAQDLRLRLPGATVRTFPWNPSGRPDLWVAVDVSRFEATDAAVVELHSRWTLKDPSEKTVLVTRETDLSEPITGTGTEATVAALGRAVAALSDVIAGEIAGHAAAAVAPPPSGRVKR